MQKDISSESIRFEMRRANTTFIEVENPNHMTQVVDNKIKEHINWYMSRDPKPTFIVIISDDKGFGDTLRDLNDKGIKTMLFHKKRHRYGHQFKNFHLAAQHFYELDWNDYKK